MAKLKIDSSNLAYLIMCLSGIVLFFLVGIYPNMTAMAQLDTELAALQEKIEAQTLLNPVYRKLIEEVQLPLPSDLPLTAPSKIDQNNLARLNETLASLAQNSDLVLERAVPDASSYRDDSNRLSVTAAFSGDFFNFRNLLMAICRMSFLNRIDQLRIETDGNDKRLIMKMEMIQ